MRYKMWTGPCGVREVADAVASLGHGSGVTNVLAGTEHIYFDSRHSPFGIKRIAYMCISSRACWPFLPGMHQNNLFASPDIAHSCEFCGDSLNAWPNTRYSLDWCLACHDVHSIYSRCRGAM